MTCNHDKTSFVGAFSMVGGYKCNNCGFNIDPVVEHWRKNLPHILFTAENQEQLQNYLDKLPKEQLELMQYSIAN